MPNEQLESRPIQETGEAGIAQVNEALGRELLKELAESSRAGRAEEGKPPTESMLMAGQTPEDGLKSVQKVIDQGVQETPQLYKDSLLDLLPRGIQGARTLDLDFQPAQTGGEYINASDHPAIRRRARATNPCASPLE